MENTQASLFIRKNRTFVMNPTAFEAQLGTSARAPPAKKAAYLYVSSPTPCPLSFWCSCCCLSSWEGSGGWGVGAVKTVLPAMR